MLVYQRVCFIHVSNFSRDIDPKFSYVRIPHEFIPLVGGLEHLLFFHILGIIILTDFHIVQMG
jgi:hypothetical protein